RPRSPSPCRVEVRRDHAQLSCADCAHKRAACRRRGEVLQRLCEERARSDRSEEHTSELQSLTNLVCRLLLEKKKKKEKHKKHDRYWYRTPKTHQKRTGSS